uniref:Uncharacterized protein n=1 Tax=Anguilla anguilla TaxID=7936 RepID=A0A0E9SXE3_ANGAN
MQRQVWSKPSEVNTTTRNCFYAAYSKLGSSPVHRSTLDHI